ncbi:hypothetical protein B0H11DRAFT_2259459 [Mycena galericulata]|nr:hypothetical protein B0H11DRAFT_2259459 [Mycena galericulata]
MLTLPTLTVALRPLSTNLSTLPQWIISLFRARHGRDVWAFKWDVGVYFLLVPALLGDSTMDVCMLAFLDLHLGSHLKFGGNMYSVHTLDTAADPTMFGRERLHRFRMSAHCIQG